MRDSRREFNNFCAIGLAHALLNKTTEEPKTTASKVKKGALMFKWTEDMVEELLQTLHRNKSMMANNKKAYPNVY